MKGGDTKPVRLWTVLLAMVFLFAGCRTLPERTLTERKGDEIVVAGRFFPTGTKVVTWLDQGGYNAYKVPAGGAENHDVRNVLTSHPDRRGELALLQKHVDQVVLHYDNAGLSRLTFGILQKRGLSAHFLVDVDGTIYQTLDLRERAWHATSANDRSIGVEIAQIGAFPPAESAATARWYVRDANNQVRLKPPAGITATGILTPGFIGHPARNEPVQGAIQGRELAQYDFTAEQYAALAHLAAALNQVLPKIRLEAPRGPDGLVPARKLPDKALVEFKGILGHYHIQENKIDPGPALQWEKLIKEARAIRQAKE